MINVAIFMPLGVSLVELYDNKTYTHTVEVREAQAYEDVTVEDTVPAVNEKVERAIADIPHTQPQTETIIRYIYDEAPKYGIDPDEVAHTIYCESKFYNVQSAVVKNGVQEPSWGLAQIHIPSHPNVTVEQALTPTFAVDWMLTNWNTVAWYGHNRFTDECTNGITEYWTKHL